VNYRSGRMGMSGAIALAFIISFPSVFLSAPAVLAEASGPLSWATPLTGGLAVGVLLWVQAWLCGRYRRDLLDVAEYLLGRPAALITGLFYFAVFFATACLWTRQFAENTLLTALPAAEFNNVVYVYAAAAMFLVYCGIEAIARTTYILLPFAVAGMLLVFAGLAPLMKPLYLVPLFGNGLATLAEPSLFIFGYSTTVTLLAVLGPVFQNTSTLKAAIIFGYGGSALLRSLTNAVYVMVFSAAVGKEKMLPFYELARTIYINRYVQRLEALFILLWVMVGLLGIAACLYGALYVLARLFRLPSPMPLLLPLGLIMTNIAAMPPDAGQVLILGTTLYDAVYAPGFAITTLGLFAAALLKGGKKQCSSARR
jgi:spore germination protein (amino acid permease)